MVRYYIIEWCPTKELNRNNNFHRINKVILNKPTGNVSIDAKEALNMFIKNFGGLHKNTIFKIKEFNENGQIGEDIVPQKEAIIPEKKA